MTYNLLKGKRGIIFGALDESSIAWKVAERAHAEGAIFTLSNVPVSIRIGMACKPMWAADETKNTPIC